MDFSWLPILCVAKLLNQLSRQSLVMYHFTEISKIADTKVRDETDMSFHFSKVVLPKISKDTYRK